MRVNENLKKHQVKTTVNFLHYHKNILESICEENISGLHGKYIDKIDLYV